MAIRQYALVRFRHELRKKEIEEGYYAALIGKEFIYLGDIPNQPGHCVLVEIGPKPDLLGSAIRLFHHTSDFEEIPEDEL